MSQHILVVSAVNLLQVPDSLNCVDNMLRHGTVQPVLLSTLLSSRKRSLVLSGLGSAENSKQANAHWYMTLQQLQSVHAGCKVLAAMLHVCCSIVVALTSCLFAHFTSR